MITEEEARLRAEERPEHIWHVWIALAGTFSLLLCAFGEQLDHALARLLH